VLDLTQADFHRLLVEKRHLAHSPAQVDGLEAGGVAGAQLAQAREDLLLQSAALGFQVAEGGGDENTEGASGLWQSLFPLRTHRMVWNAHRHID